ncbi:MAG: hypothetical protein R2759_01330 [Bacteroidales bacterium]
MRENGVSELHGLMVWNYRLEEPEGRLTGWISYTYSRVFKKIDGLNEGNEFPAYYDRPNDFSIFLSLPPFQTGKYFSQLDILHRFGHHHSHWFLQLTEAPYRFTAKKITTDCRIIIGWMLLWPVMLNKPGNNFQHSLSFAIYNFYNRHNPVSVNFNKVETKEGKFVVPANLYGTQDVMVTQKYLLGIMPSITYKFKI